MTLPHRAATTQTGRTSAHGAHGGSELVRDGGCRCRSKSRQICRSRSSDPGLRSDRDPQKSCSDERAPGACFTVSTGPGDARVLRLEELLVIHQLREQGESVSEIARRTGLDRKTVRKYLKQGLERPTYGPRAPRPRVIDPHRKYLRERLDRYPTLSAMRLLCETRKLGCGGGRTAVTDYIATIRPRPVDGVGGWGRRCRSRAWSRGSGAGCTRPGTS